MDDNPSNNCSISSDPEIGSEGGGGGDHSGTHISNTDNIMSFATTHLPPEIEKIYSNWENIVLAYQSLGVVYGDLGTSPVNVFSATRFTNLREDDLLGTLSLIIWTLTLLVLIKYVFIVMHANDHGEGGTFALYSYIRRHINFTTNFTIRNVRLDSRTPSPTRVKGFLERSTFGQNFVTIIVLLGTCMVIGDGALTPATCGAEAMFADLGHFNKRGIQLGFSFVVYPSLIVTYAGQTAYLLKHPENVVDAYYSSVPDPVYWPMFVISTLAAVVASQSMISACFSIVKQSLELDCFPRVSIIHTSSKHQGQVYSPEINCILMILTVGLVVGFKGGVELANAYGVVVIWVMIITTCLMSLVMLTIWKMNAVVVLGFFVPYVVLEGAFMTSLLQKIPQGGWVPFAISALFMVVMMSWKYGRSKKTTYEAKNKMSATELDDALSGSNGFCRTPGVCFFFTDLVYGIPPIIRHYIQHTSSVREIMVLVTIRTLPIKTIAPTERLYVQKLGRHGVYQCLIQFGYNDAKNMNGAEYAGSIVAKLVELIDDPSEVQKIQSTMKRGIVFVTGRTILKANKKSGMLARFTINYLYRFLQKNSKPAFPTLQTPPQATMQVGMLYES
ncbi:hypothetical protein SASPL_149350 [Salvia splendens]|uniref:Potassium transporter n=1 Tax=Salvia splendens TaxID=180675 RepID=A0A8X8WC16_SALSN|nr:hypothetical protein SASPL_149350 [Salvia splendens]